MSHSQQIHFAVQVLAQKKKNIILVLGYLPLYPAASNYQWPGTRVEEINAINREIAKNKTP